MTLLEREREVLAAAPSHDELVLRLRAVVKDALATGTPREEVLRALDHAQGPGMAEHPRHLRRRRGGGARAQGEARA